MRGAPEPTGEQIGELFERAFADVERKHRESLVRLRAEIARLRVEARRLDDIEFTGWRSGKLDLVEPPA